MKKVYILYGPDIIQRTSNKANLTSPDLLKKVVEVEVIGDKDGFELHELESFFNSDETDYSIIINAHGVVNEGIHEFITKSFPAEKNNTPKITQQTPAECLLQKIVSVTNYKPLNILSTACYGENLHDHLDLLPPLSKIITFNDKDSVGYVLDTFGMHYEAELKPIAGDNFQLEHLMQLFCLNQKFGQTTPVVSEKTPFENIITKNLADYASYCIKYKSFEKSPSRFNQFFDDFSISERAEKLIDQIRNGKNIKNFKLPQHVGLKILENCDHNNLAAFNKELEDKFYYPGALSKFNYPEILKYNNKILKLKQEFDKKLEAEEFQSLPNTIPELENMLNASESATIRRPIFEKKDIIRTFAFNKKSIETDCKNNTKIENCATPVYFQTIHKVYEYQDSNLWVEDFTNENINYPLSNYSLLLVLGAEAMVQEVLTGFD